MAHHAEDQPEEKQSIMETIVDRIGFARYHIQAYFFFFCSYLAEGAGMVSITFLNYIFMNVVWFKSMDEIGLISTSMFVGCSIGSVSVGYIADHYGRKGCYIMSALICGLIGIISSFAPDIWFLILARGIFGFAFGLMIPAAVAYGTEISPKRYRGIDYINLNFAFISGELIGVAIAASLHVDQVGSENWRMMLVWDGLPSILAAVLFWKFQMESPRFEILRDFDKGLGIYNEMHKKNRGSELQLTQGEREEIVAWVNKQKEKHIEPTVKDLFKNGWWKITLPVWGVSINQCSLYFGNFFILPLVLDALESLEDSKEGKPLVVHHGIHYLQSVYLVLSEIPAQIMVSFLVRSKTFGRRNSLMMVYLCYFFVGLLIYYVPSTINWGSPFLKFLGSAGYSLGGTYVSELYHTKHRSTGIGFFNLWDRLGGIIMPYVMFHGLNIAPTGPYLILAIQALLGFGCCALMAYDTTFRDLDKHHEQKDEGEVEMHEYKKL